MVPFWALALVFWFTLSECTGQSRIRHQHREEADGHDDTFEPRTSIMQFIIQKGCGYVSLFVWSHYMKHAPTYDDHRRFVLEPKCNWQGRVKKITASVNVPAELTRALLDCGPATSFCTIGIDDWQKKYDHCNLTYLTDHGHEYHGPILVGKRDNHPNHGDVACPIRRPPTRNVHAERSTDITDSVDVNVWVQPHSSSLPNTRKNTLIAPEEIIRNATLLRWCNMYSRRVTRLFHLDRKKFVRTSRHWLVDVYRMAEKLAAPRSYIHGLVGCGQKYALDAFGVPASLSILYSRS